MLTLDICNAVRLDHAVLPAGVTFEHRLFEPSVEKTWFKWYPYELCLNNAVHSMGLLSACYVQNARFTEVEWHTTAETFLVVKGEATLLLQNDTEWGLVALPCGTAICVQNGVRHYIGPSLTHEAFCAVMTSVDSKTTTEVI